MPERVLMSMTDAEAENFRSEFHNLVKDFHQLVVQVNTQIPILTDRLQSIAERNSQVNSSLSDVIKLVPRVDSMLAEHKDLSHRLDEHDDSFIEIKALLSPLGERVSHAKALSWSLLFLLLGILAALVVHVVK